MQHISVDEFNRIWESSAINEYGDKLVILPAGTPQSGVHEVIAHSLAMRYGQSVHVTVAD